MRKLLFSLLVFASIARAQNGLAQGGVLRPSGGGANPVGGVCAVQLEGSPTAFAGDNSALCGTLAPIVPGAPAVTPTGAGAETWSYACTAVNLLGEGVAGAAASDTNAGTLDGSHVNHVTCPVTAGALSCNIYITAAGTGGSTGLIDSGNPCGTTFNDSTGAGSGDPPATDETFGLFVLGNLSVQKHAFIGQNDDGPSSPSPEAVLIVADTFSGDAIGMKASASSTGDGAASYGQFLNSALFGMSGLAYGAIDQANYFGSGTADLVAGVRGIVFVTPGNATLAYGVQGLCDNGGAGTIADCFSMYVATPINSGGGAITRTAAWFNQNQAGVDGIGEAYAWFSEGGENHLETGGATVVGMEIEQFMAQSANLFQLVADDGTTVLTYFDAAAQLFITAQKSTTGARFVCIDTAGQLISSVAACVGT